MKHKIRFNEKGLYTMVHALLLVLTGLLLTGSFMGIQALGVVHILVAIMAVFLQALFHFMSKKGRFFFFLGLCMFLFIVFAVTGRENSVTFLNSYMQWLMGSAAWMEEWVVGYEILQTLLIVGICYVLQLIVEKDFRLRIVLAGILAVVLFYHLFSKKELSHFCVVVIFLYIVMTVTEHIQRRWEKIRSRSVQAHMLWIMPFFVVYLVIMALMPAPKEAYDWQAFKDFYKQAKQSILTLTENFSFGNKEDYDLNLSGFSERGRLGGDVLDNDREIMTVQGQKSLVTNVYLTGKVFDTFDGRQWQQLGDSVEKERYLDTLETLYAAERYDKKYLTDYLARTELTVTFRQFRSGYLFAPLKAWGLSENHKNLVFSEKEGSLLVEEKRGYGSEYKVIFYQMNRNQEAFNDFLKASTEPDVELLEELLGHLKGQTGEAFTINDLQNHRQLVYDNYLSEVVLTERTQEYLDKITEEFETDVEKLYAIESALSSFSYNQNPGELPKKVTDAGSFLDYFLFESREGYCNYFATAFVLLARAEGIPARYVQGYCVPMKGESETVVYSSMAHAWPEVYLDGIGWIPFEPTPGYAKIRYTSWKLRSRKDAAISEVNPTYNNGLSQSQQDISTEEFIDENLEEEKKEEQRGKWRKFLVILFMTIVSILSLFIIALLINIIISNLMYQRMSKEEKFQTEVYKCLRILSWLGIKRAEGETLEELKRRGEYFLAEKDLLWFLEVYEGLLYGESKMKKEQLTGIKQAQSKLLEVLKRKKRWAYVYYRVRIDGLRKEK